MKEQRLNHLFDLYLNQAANPAEEAELMQLLADPTLTEERQKLFYRLVSLPTETERKYSDL